MKDWIMGLLFGIIFLYVSTSLFVFLTASINNSKCLNTPFRIESFFPAYKFGCYMFSKEGEQYYYEEK